MIVGVGIDIVKIERIKKVIDRHGDNFLKYVFTDNEISAAPINITKRGAYFAARWAAKEAMSKALKCGIGENCRWLDMEVVKDEFGAPSLILSGNAACNAKKQEITKVHLSISHEIDVAIAIVIADSAS